MFQNDLPEPVRQTLTPEQKFQRRHQFAIILNGFVLGYNALHKFIMPLYIGLSTHKSGEWLKLLDWWWLLHVAMAILLKRKKWDDAWLRLVLFTTLGGVLLEFMISFSEYNWGVVSVWVTSAATLVVVFYLLSLSRYQASTRTRVGLAGAGLFIGFASQAVLLRSSLFLIFF